ncbi:hypothetical protein [Nostoc sp.]
MPTLFQGVPAPRLPDGSPKGNEAKRNVVEKTLGTLYGTPTPKS